MIMQMIIMIITITITAISKQNTIIRTVIMITTATKNTTLMKANDNDNIN